MAPDWRYTAIEHPSGTKRQIVASFSDDEWDALSSYDEYSAQLANVRMVRKGASSKATIRWEKDGPLRWSAEQPPEDEVVVMLYRLRPFLLKKEPTHFGRVCNHIGRRVQEPSLRAFLQSQKELFHGAQMEQQFEILSDGIVLNCETMLFKWLNAFEYHRDLDKRREIERLHKLIPLEFTRAILVMMLYDKVEAIMNVRGLVGTILGKQGSYKIPMVPGPNATG